MSDISLTASMRSNLLSLQNTQSLMDTTQERLSTGKKVNSALDNPSSFYTAQSLNNRASDLSSLLDSMGQGIQTIKAADEAITSITSFVQQAKAVANSARDEANKVATSTGTYDKESVAAEEVVGSITYNGKTMELKFTPAAKAEGSAVATSIATAIKAIDFGTAGNEVKLADADFSVNFDNGAFSVTSKKGEEIKVSFEVGGAKMDATAGNASRVKSLQQYNDILTQIDQLAKDAGYKGVNLLQENSLTVVFNEDRSSSITIKGVDASSKGLGITAATDWGDNDKITADLNKIDAAISTLRSMSSEFGNNYSIVQTREDFTENLVNVLTEGADKLTLADMNEESANMLALQTRQQLAINSLSLASQAAQSVLKLF